MVYLKSLFIIGLLVVTYSWAEFSDDFSNPANSNTQWAKGADFISMEFKNGVCKVINTDPNYIGTI
ncbi:MAG: hypothetical protein N2053_06500, partial [Chitinispirillaceae bacterium]|nr:hypothetical protein [Chitinispirillaceae bacterium]